MSLLPSWAELQACAAVSRPADSALTRPLRSQSRGVPSPSRRAPGTGIARPRECQRAVGVLSAGNNTGAQAKLLALACAKAPVETAGRTAPTMSRVLDRPMRLDRDNPLW